MASSRGSHGPRTGFSVRWGYASGLNQEELMEATGIANKLGLGAVVCLVAAFVLTTMPVLLAPASAESVAGVRDDDARDVAAVSDDDDDDYDDDTGDRDSRSGSNSGSRSYGSRSGNTGTGTTRGTGVSNSVSNSSGASKNTATGTTRGTGKSRSVSNSS
jgi:hypothetical protein